MWRVRQRMSGAAAVGRDCGWAFYVAVQRQGSRLRRSEVFLLRAQALRPGLNCDAPPALRTGAGRARKPVRLGAGTAVPCPYKGEMRPAAWARPFFVRITLGTPLHLPKSEEADESWRGHGCAVPLHGKKRRRARDSK